MILVKVCSKIDDLKVLTKCLIYPFRFYIFLKLQIVLDTKQMFYQSLNYFYNLISRINYFTNVFFLF